MSTQHPSRRHKTQQQTRKIESEIKAKAKQGTQQGKALAKQQAANSSSSANRSLIGTVARLGMGAIPQVVAGAAKFFGGTGEGYQPNPTPPKTKHHSSNPVNRPRH